MGTLELEELGIELEKATGIIKAYEFGIFENPFDEKYLNTMRLGYIKAIDLLEEVQAKINNEVKRKLKESGRNEEKEINATTQWVW